MWCLQEPSVVQCSHVCTLWLVGQGRRAQPRPGGALSLVEERRGAVIGRVRRWLVACRTRVGYVANKFLLCAAASMPSCQPAANRCIHQSTHPPHLLIHLIFSSTSPPDAETMERVSKGKWWREFKRRALDTIRKPSADGEDIQGDNNRKFCPGKIYETMLQRTEFSCHNSHGVESHLSAI